MSTIYVSSTIVPLGCKDRFTASAVQEISPRERKLLWIRGFETPAAADAAVDEYLNTHKEAQRRPTACGA